MTVRDFIQFLEALAMPDARVMLDIDHGGMKFSLEPTYVIGEPDHDVVEIGTSC
jgi:hypothetical protein